MYEIMRDSRVLRLPRPDLFQDFRSLELIGIALIGERSPDIEGKRVMDLRFVVAGIAVRELFHCFEIGEDACAMIDLLIIRIHFSESVEVIALSLCLRAQCLPLLDRGSALCQVLRWRCNMRIVQEAQRDTPIGDGTFGIGLKRVFKRLLGCPVPERVLVEHGAVEMPLSRFATRGRKVNGAQTLIGFCLSEGSWREQNPKSCAESAPSR